MKISIFPKPWPSRMNGDKGSITHPLDNFDERKQEDWPMCRLIEGLEHDYEMCKLFGPDYKEKTRQENIKKYGKPNPTLIERLRKDKQTKILVEDK